MCVTLKNITLSNSTEPAPAAKLYSKYKQIDLKYASMCKERNLGVETQDHLRSETILRVSRDKAA